MDQPLPGLAFAVPLMSEIDPPDRINGAAYLMDA
jgi:hypothetical protein